MKKKKAILTPDQILCLKNQTFSDNEPGTLLKDFLVCLILSALVAFQSLGKII